MAYKKSNANGQATMANSEPVVIASDQSAVPVSAASLPLPSGASTSAKQDTGNTSLASIDGKITAVNTGAVVVSSSALPSGASTAAAQATLETDVEGINTRLGEVQASPTANTVLDRLKALLTELQLKSDLTETQPVSLASVPSHPVTNAGTFATQVDGAALTALQLIDDVVFADDAAFTLSTSKGHVMAGVAVNTDGTDPTAVSAEGDAAAVRTDVNRILLVNETHPRFWHVSADYASAQTNTSVKASPGASLSLYITDIQVSNGATAGNITLLDGSGGTVLYEIYPGINGGAVMSLRSPIKLTANTALCITSTTVTTHSIFVSGYIAP